MAFLVLSGLWAIWSGSWSPELCWVWVPLAFISFRMLPLHWFYILPLKCPSIPAALPAFASSTPCPLHIWCFHSCPYLPLAQFTCKICSVFPSQGDPRVLFRVRPELQHVYFGPRSASLLPVFITLPSHLWHDPRWAVWVYMLAFMLLLFYLLCSKRRCGNTFILVFLLVASSQ